MKLEADCFPGNINLKWLDWVIVGAQTGPGAQFMTQTWACIIKEGCRKYEIPFFFKKGSDGSRILDGREWNEVPR